METVGKDACSSSSSLTILTRVDKNFYHNHFLFTLWEQRYVWYLGIVLLLQGFLFGIRALSLVLVNSIGLRHRIKKQADDVELILTQVVKKRTILHLKYD